MAITVLMIIVIYFDFSRCVLIIMLLDRYLDGDGERKKTHISSKFNFNLQVQVLNADEGYP